MVALLEVQQKKSAGSSSNAWAVPAPDHLPGLIATIGLCLAAFVLPTMAEEAPRPDDRAAIDGCLQHAKAMPQSCIGAVFKPCVEAPRGPNDPFPHGSTAGQNECANREIAVWDEKIDASLKQLRAGPLGATVAQPWNRPPQNRRDHAVPGTVIIDDMERTWVLWRAKMCDTEAMQYEGGTLSSVVYGKCVYTETGRHALWLLQQVDDNAPR